MSGTGWIASGAAPPGRIGRAACTLDSMLSRARLDPTPGPTQSSARERPLRSPAGSLAARVSLVTMALLSGCGGASTTAPTPTGERVAADDPGPRCIAIANARRERAPGEPASVGIAQILVHHVEAKRPAEGVRRSRVEACLRAMEARDALRAGADFEEVVARYSDEAGAATRGGRLGSVRREELVAPIADAAFELELAELSDVVETEFGFHLVLRTE